MTWSSQETIARNQSTLHRALVSAGQLRRHARNRALRQAEKDRLITERNRHLTLPESDAGQILAMTGPNPTPAMLQASATALAKLRSGRSGSRPGRPKPVPAPKLVLTYDDPVSSTAQPLIPAQTLPFSGPDQSLAPVPVPALAPVPVPVTAPVPVPLKPSLQPRPDQWDD
jgi:hypothetical protein